MKKSLDTPLVNFQAKKEICEKKNLHRAFAKACVFFTWGKKKTKSPKLTRLSNLETHQKNNEKGNVSKRSKKKKSSRVVFFWWLLQKISALGNCAFTKKIQN